MSAKKTGQKFSGQYQELNTAQKKAVEAIEGPVLVVAGPGSGKTGVLSMRAASILKETDANPSNILCLTFTEAAAMNMKRRLAELIGKDAYQTAIYTFHSFGVEIIQRYSEYFFGGTSFYPADELVQLEVLEAIFHEMRHDNPLRSEHPEFGFVYLSETLQALQRIKKAGLTPEEFRDILEHNAETLKALEGRFASVFSARISQATIASARELVLETEKRAEAETPMPVPYFSSLSEVLAGSLKQAVDEAEESGKTKPLSDWKRQNLKKNDSGALVLKETKYLEKMRALAHVYETYGGRMYEKGYYDYEDMLLEVIEAVERYPELKHELWEQFQYIQVDEFQDTNDAQMRLLSLLTDAEATEGRPNICAVGDDDQAIYKFQGALISNILDFRERYRDPELVVLTENYRSTQHILDLGRFLIQKGQDRLERRIPELEKTLSASNTELGPGRVALRDFSTDFAEYSWIAGEIRRLIDEGQDPRDIAVISRRHQELVEFSKYLDAHAVPTYYERNQNVFDQEHVHELVQMARFVGSLLEKDHDEADELLPEILSFEFWQLPRTTLWDIASRAERGKKHRQKWLDVMLAHENEEVRQIAHFFLETARMAKTHPLPEVLDVLIGEHVTFRASVSEASEQTAQFKTQKSKKAAFTSPFKQYYFNAERFERAPVEYLNFLSALQVFVSAVREYRSGETVGLQDLVRFVDRHERFGIPVIDTSPFMAGENAVTLLSAHKAKGLEFESVFVLSCQEGVWAKSASRQKLVFPRNLPLEPAGDTEDDHLRLFFVAVTRAKEQLYLSYYRQRHDGKPSEPLHFLESKETEELSASHGEKIEAMLAPESPETSTHETDGGYGARPLLDAWQAAHAGPYVADEQAMLSKLLEHYQMSPTHLNNFLNVLEGGPAFFLEQSLLHFPQAKPAVMSYGTAMHGALEELYKKYRFFHELPSRAFLLEAFHELLLKERLTEEQFQKWLTQGKEALGAYYDKRAGTFSAEDKIEVNFKNEGVVVEGAHLTGKIDKVRVGENAAEVVDFKTGKVASSWKGSGEPEKQKLERYKNQLLFYKILVEHSARFGGQRVDQGTLEFLEPDSAGEFHTLSLEFDDEQTQRMKKLIGVVHEKIKNLDFVDTSGYSKDLAGIKAFEDDLLEGRM